MSDNETLPTSPPFDGESENSALPDPVAPTAPVPGANTTSTDADDKPPPMNAPARGPMDQVVPDVATGSTPVTRRDD
jgi:hypothetical protein